MKITNCNTMEKVLCGCTLSFSTYIASSTSVLDVGNLVGGSCTFTSYVIDWYRDGIKELVSGTAGSATDVTAYHPFTGTGAIPVQGGTWVPVVRWVVIAGVKYHSKPTKCKKWCATLTGLPTITVSSLSCASVMSTGTNYQWRLSYTTTQDFALAARLVTWVLAADTKYFAVEFRGETVVDRIEIFKNTESNRLIAWDVGSDNTAYSTAAMPYKYDYTTVKFVIDVGAYTTGDFLIIKITPSVYVTNTNTIWSAYFKCLTASTDFVGECAKYNDNMRILDVSTIQMVWDQAGCAYKMTANMVQALPVRTTSPLYLWADMNGMSGGANQYNETTNLFNTVHTWSTYVASTYIANYQNNCVASAGLMNLARTGSVFTFTFSSVTDYEYFRNLLIGYFSPTGLWQTRWVNNNTDIRFGAYIQWIWKQANSCGDTIITSSIYFHVTSIFTYDDGLKTITIDVKNPAFNLPACAACDYSCSTAASAVSSVANTITLTSGLGNTYVKATSPMAVWNYTGYTYNKILSASGFFAHQFRNYRTSPCGFPGCDYMGQGSLYFFNGVIKSVITNVNDPINNFTVYSNYNSATKCHSGPDIKLYEKVNGVKVFPL